MGQSLDCNEKCCQNQLDSCDLNYQRVKTDTNEAHGIQATFAVIRDHAACDPRHMLSEFLGPGDERGPAGVLKYRGLTTSGRETRWFAVFRPTSMDAIRMIMQQRATGKGLNVKGKSAKSGVLSGFVPVLQISEIAHKQKVCTSPKDARCRIYYQSSALRDTALQNMTSTANEMQRLVFLAAKKLDEHKGGKTKLDDAALQGAYDIMTLAVEDPSILSIDTFAPETYGLEVPERVFREAYITRRDIRRKGDWKTGRESEPAFMDMNLHSLRDESATERAVVLQRDDRDPMNPLSLLMAYEQGEVKAIVSDIDAFMFGSKGPVQYNQLAQEQVSAMRWCLRCIEEVLESPEPMGWISRWLGILKRETHAGWHPDILSCGFGDKTSCTIIERLVQAMGIHGAVRHAECFNFYFPQDLDEELLVIWEGFGEERPWRYKTEPELREFLLDMVQRGYSFPVNPKWIVCDRGWCKVFEALRSSVHGRAQLLSWYPEGSGLVEKIDELCKRFPEGFHPSPGGPAAPDLDPDLARLQLRRYQSLQRAWKKLKIVLKWLKVSKSK